MPVKQLGSRQLEMLRKISDSATPWSYRSERPVSTALSIALSLQAKGLVQRVSTDTFRINRYGQETLRMAKK